MELGLVAGGLCVAVLAVLIAIVIYYISVSTMKEKTYDEVKAEQKKKAEEFLAQGRTAKEKAKDKKLKKAGKKVKEKKSSEVVELSSDEAPVEVSKGHVAFLEKPIVVDEEPIVIEEKKKKSNKKKEKPILLNKNEITPIAEVPPPIINHFEQIVPKDDFTLKRSISREDVEVKPAESQPAFSQKQASTKHNKAPVANSQKEQKAEQKAPAAKSIQKAAEKTTVPPKINEKSNSAKLQEKIPQEKVKPVEEVLVVKTAPKQSQNAPPPPSSDNHSPSTKISRKKRSDLATLTGDKEAVNVNLLVPLVHKAELSRTDVQVLIDLLLNKQQGSATDSTEWIEGRQDPVAKLKKQLAERERALTEEQSAAAALQVKLRELRGELNAERQNTRQLEDSLNQRRAELNSLGGRLAHSAEEKQTLLQQIQQLQAKLSEEHMMLCKLQEDQSQTQTVLQQELLSQRQQLEMHIARLTEQHQETIAAMEVQMNQMTVQLQQQQEITERAVLQDSQDLTRQKLIKEMQADMERIRSKSQYDISRLQEEVRSLTEQLTVKRAETDKLNSLVTSLQADNSRLSHQVSSACVEAQQLRDENETLAAQVTASMERPATEGRENGDLTYHEGKHIHTDSDKMHEKELLVEKLKDDLVSKDKEINCFKTDSAQQESLIKSLKSELDTAYANSEKMLREISSYKSLIQDHEGVIKALREEGESAHKLVNTLREDISKNKMELVRLSKDCATREQLESRESTIERLTSELNTHKTKLADQTALIQVLQAEVEKFKAQVASKHSTTERYEQLVSELNSCQTTLAERESEVKELRKAAEQQQQQLATLLGQNKELQQQLETQRRKNDDLRSKNWKAMEALSTAEKNLETKVKQSQIVVSEAEERSRFEEQARTKQLLQRILPHVTIDSKQNYEAWLEQFARTVATCASPAESEGTSDAAMLAEVEEQNCKLQAMVSHYKSIIADTEGMLNRLQSHVEQEEGRWGQQIQTLENQLQAVILERDRLEAGTKNGLSTADDGSDTN